MSQSDLFGVRALCTGFGMVMDRRVLESGVVTQLSISPKWSKKPQKDGLVCVLLDECTEQLVPELVRDVMDGLSTSDPGVWIPRWVKQHLKDYEEASYGQLPQY